MPLSQKYESVLLLKLPFCTHPDAEGSDADFRTKAPFRPVPSLALASLAAFIDENKSLDYKLQVVDINIEAYTEPGIPIDTSVYSELLSKTIEDNHYEALALSAMFVFNVRWVETAVTLSRKAHPNAKIILGGGYPTLFPEYCLERHDIDDVVIGEGEATFLHILNKYNSHRDIEFENKFPFQGYATRNDRNEIIKNDISHFMDLADLPIPAWHVLDVDKYLKNSGDKMLPIEGSRGCPYNCTFCSTHISWGKKVRYKPVENLLKEMTETGSRHAIDTLHFVDDSLGLSKKWLIQLLQEIIKLKLDLKFSVSNFSVNHLDEEVIDLLGEAVGEGQFIGVAVESGCQEIQRKIKKNLDFNKVRNIINLMKTKNLHVHICWMIGFPHETIEQIQKTFAFARELQAHSNQFLTVTPYPRTELFEEAKDANLLQFPEYDFDRYDNRRSDYLKSNEWDYALLREMIYDANIEINFLNNPQLDTDEGRDMFLIYLLELLKRLPEHIISRILVGYIYKKKGLVSKGQDYYDSALNLLTDPKLHETFKKYLTWDYESILDFNDYHSGKKPQTKDCPEKPS